MQPKHTLAFARARRRARLSLAVSALLTSFSIGALAGTPPPDSGILLDTVKPPPSPPPKPAGELISPAPEARPALESAPGLRVRLKSVRFTGATAIPLSTLEALVRPDLGKELSFEELQALAARVTKLYRSRGYFIARAYLPQQPLEGGNLEILILEGHIGKVEVRYHSKGPRIAKSLMAGIVRDAVPTGKPVEVSQLERAMLLENDLPNVTAHATLVPGASVGTSDLVLEANQSGWFSKDTIEADNAGSRYSGAGRFGGSVNVASPAGIGDLLSLRALTSFTGFDYGRLSWTAPAGGSGLRVGASGTYSDYKLGGPLSALDDRGDANVFSLFSVYPVVRSRFFNLYQTATVETKSLYDTSLEGPIADKRINVGTLGFNGDETDSVNGAGLSTFGAQVEFGHLGLSSDGSDAAADAMTARTAGSYRKLMLQAVRQQRLSDSWTLYGSANAQIASKNLDSSESLPFGGPSGVRAYPVGEAPADEGVMATLELRYNMPAPASLGALQWQLFADHGSVTLHKNLWSEYVASGAPRSYDLNAAGLGVNLYREGSLLITASAAHKIGTNPDPGLGGVDADGRRLSTRWWLQCVKYW